MVEELMYVRGSQDTLDEILNWCNSLSDQTIDKKEVYKYVFALRATDILNKHYESFQSYLKFLDDN